MLWVLPINLPTLVVWIHNLTVHWLTPFSSHHNVLSILPFVLLVETLSTGKMIPRLQIVGMSGATERTLFQSLAHHTTSVLLFAMAFYAAVYGVTYAYLLHVCGNSIAAWLMIVYYANGREGGIRGVTDLLENESGREIVKEEKGGEKDKNDEVVVVNETVRKKKP
jgi:glycosylphosphatidylinositol deacylase